MRRPSVLMLLFMLAILVAPLFAPYDIRSATTVPRTRNQAPSIAHPMGTDAADRDVLSLVLKGSQVSLVIATGAVTIALIVGIVVGAVAAFSGGFVGALLMRITEVSVAIPRFLVLLAVTSIAAGALSTFQMVLLIGFTGWFDTARITRGEVASLLTRDWVLASRATGVGEVRLALRHVFPHLVPMLMVVATLGIGHTIVLEAGLMYLGASSGGTSLGSLLQEGAGIITTRWWLTLFPGLAIVTITLACNTLGDSLRDVFAPEQVHAWPTT